MVISSRPRTVVLMAVSIAIGVTVGITNDRTVFGPAANAKSGALDGINSSASATSLPTRIEFVAPAGSVVIGSGDTGDVIVITGRSLGWGSAGTCIGTTDDYPRQMGVAVDPHDGGRGPRTTEIMPLISDPLRPGTRLKNIALVSDCAVGAEPFQKFTGDVE